jgi:hypothetical protein
VEDLAPRCSPAAGRLEAAGRRTCILHTGSNSLDELAIYIAVKGFGFQVLDPPELVPVLHTLAERLSQAAHATETAAGPPTAPDFTGTERRA